MKRLYGVDSSGEMGFLTSALFAVGTGFTLEHSGCIQELRPTGLKGHSWLICQMFEAGSLNWISFAGSWQNSVLHGPFE